MTFPRKLVAASAVALLALTGCSAADEEAADAEAEGGAPTPDLSGLPDVVAVVNGEEIDADEFTETYESQYQQATMMQQQSGEPVDEDALKEQVADLLVNNLLLQQAAAEEGIEPDDEAIDKVLEDLAAQSGLESGDAVIEAFAEQGMSEEQVREDAANQVVIDEYVATATDVSEPSDEELRAQYDQMVEQSQAQGEEAAAQVPPFEEVRDQLAEQAMMEEQNAAISEVLEGLRAEGSVEITL